MGSDWGTLSVTTQLVDSDCDGNGRQMIPSETFPGRVVAHGLSRFPYAALEIHDTGPSLSPGVRAILAGPRAMRDPGATGSGDRSADVDLPDERSGALCVARTVLRAHDGELLVDSAVGCGTRALVLLPV
jgi:signal transduction histidine kinase